MKISIPQAGVGAARVQQVKVGEVRLGPAQVGRLTLSDLKLRTATGVAQLRNLRVDLTLKFALKWTVGLVIDMPDPFGDVNLSDSGTLDLGSVTLGIGFGHITLPGLADLALDLPSLQVPDLSALIGPLRNLNLGAALAERIRVDGLVAPARGFTLDGLGLGSVSAQGLALDGATVAAATIGRVSGGSLPLAAIGIPGVTLPAVTLPRVRCGHIAATANPVVTKLPTADAGLLKAALAVTTTAAFAMDELRIDGVKASASIGEIALKDVVLPYEILDLSLAQVGIEQIDIPQAEVN